MSTDYRVPFDVPSLYYGDALRTLRETLRFGISPLLETVEEMLAELDDPDTRFGSIQIAGTNGKTSTSRYTAAILMGEGVRCALYTSPELVSYTERMEIQGSPVSEEEFAYAVSAALEAGRRVNARRAEAGERPYDITEFDLLTVAACVVYARAGVDAAVLECGMGGRWDATSAVKSIRSVAVTGVGLDHMHVLGDTLEAIAAEKAAVIKPGRTCVLGVGTATPSSVEDVFLMQCFEQDVTPMLLRPEFLEDAAGEMGEGVPRMHGGLPHASYAITKHPARLGAPLELQVTTPRASYPELAALKPGYQAANIACAVCLAEDYLGRVLDLEKLYTSIIGCPTPGRFQLLRPDPPVLIDACHNPQSVGAFLAAVRAIEPETADRPLLLCAVLADKDVEGIVALLAPEFPRVACTQTASRRALAAGDLAALFQAAGAAVVGVYPSVEAAASALCGDSYIACGSITLAGEVLAQLG
ncbi:bifunctional folylpolyglutamate synthase/dihydrofolate synthase [Coriobacteriales bacterium OH1046]|nr:bifunctional folylpolyglutamate synthase/dihydrofolate synthase [Coriobacteriales bacterium OH1046]